MLIFPLLLALAACSPEKESSNKLIAPDEIAGVAAYIPFPVKITIDGKTGDWNGVPVQRVETALQKGPDRGQNQYINFSLASDAGSLYIFMESEDSNIIGGRHGVDYWNEDSMEFYLNFTGNLLANAYTDGIIQITVSAVNIGNEDPGKLSITGTNSSTLPVKAFAFKTEKGWAFEAALPLPATLNVTHGRNIGFQVHANGASHLDRDSKIVWSKIDTADQSFTDPSLFGRAIFYQIGKNDKPQPLDTGLTMSDLFKKDGAGGKNGKSIVWADEFDYKGAPDPARWDYDSEDSGKYNEELQRYTRSRKNSFVKRDALTIRAIKDGKGNWTSARLVTRGRAQWTYGYIEVCAKLCRGKGSWPAIWMMPFSDTYGPWPRSGEIDIMEFVGHDPDRIHTSVHTHAYNHRIKTQKTRAENVKGVSDEFHTYAIEWNSKGIFWYVDDEPFYYFLNEGKDSRTWPFNKPFYVILNLAMGGTWGGMYGVDEDLKRAEMVVDYVRVYQ